MPIHVAFFVSCLTDQFYPRVGVATVKVLEHFGCRVSFPAGQTCCGQPLLHAGLEPESRAVARRFVELFEKAEYIVTPSPACAATVRERYPKLLADDAAYETGMWHVAGRTYELVEFLTTIVRADLSGLKLPRPTTAAYHPACPLRTLAVADDTPRLLRQLGLKSRPLPAADVCCGFGGPFAERYPSISRTMADAKARALGATVADVTVCNEAGLYHGDHRRLRARGLTASRRPRCRTAGRGPGRGRRPLLTRPTSDWVSTQVRHGPPAPPRLAHPVPIGRAKHRRSAAAAAADGWRLVAARHASGLFNRRGAPPAQLALHVGPALPASGAGGEGLPAVGHLYCRVAGFDRVVATADEVF